MSYWKGQLFTVDSANIGHDDDALNPYNQSVASGKFRPDIYFIVGIFHWKPRLK